MKFYLSLQIIGVEKNNCSQHRIKLIAGKSLIYESPNGLSWLMFYLLN